MGLGIIEGQKAIIKGFWKADERHSSELEQAESEKNVALSAALAEYNERVNNAKNVLLVLAGLAILTLAGIMAAVSSWISSPARTYDSYGENTHVRESPSRPKPAPFIEQNRQQLADIGGGSLAMAHENDATAYVVQMLQYAMENGGIDHDGAIMEAAYTLNKRFPCPEQKSKQAANSANKAGLNFIKTDNFEQALTKFKKAHNDDHTDIEIMNNLGYAYMRTGDFKNAEKFFLKTLTYEPGRAPAWANLGEMYATQGNIKSAVAAFANTLRFTKNRDTTETFLKHFLDLDDEYLGMAAKQALELPYIEPRQIKFCSKEK